MKNIVITGANTGIGFETAKALYSDGHNIIIGSRSVPKNQAAVNTIKQAYPNSKGNIHQFPLDLSKKASVQKFAQSVKKQFNKIDILINNAGYMGTQREISQLGVEMAYTTNHFGHFYPTYLVFPLIKNSDEARIINVSSLLHLKAKQSLVADPECKNGYSQFDNYQISKLANVQSTTYLAQKVSKNPKIKVVSLHPGLVDTTFGNENCFLSCLKFFCCCCFISPQSGAATSLFLARTTYGKIQNGAYYDECEVKEMNPIANDSKLNQDLWQLGQKLYKIKFEV